MQHVLITGGSSGIGEAFAAWYLARGARVTILGRSVQRLDAAAARLCPEPESAGDTRNRLQTLSADVTDHAELASAFHQAQTRFGPVDRLITCAGSVWPGAFEALPDEAFREQMAVNYFGTVHAVRAIYPAMKARRSGRILLVSSGAGLIGLYGYSAYSPTKFALAGLAEALQAEAIVHGVSVSICFPPDTDTPQYAQETLLAPPQTRAMSRLGGGLWQPAAVAARALPAFERGRFNIHLGLGVQGLGWFGPLVRPAIRLLARPRR